MNYTFSKTQRCMKQKMVEQNSKTSRQRNETLDETRNRAKHIVKRNKTSDETKHRARKVVEQNETSDETKHRWAKRNIVKQIETLRKLSHRVN